MAAALAVVSRKLHDGVVADSRTVDKATEERWDADVDRAVAAATAATATAIATATAAVDIAAAAVAAAAADVGIVVARDVVDVVAAGNVADGRTAAAASAHTRLPVERV